MQFVLQLKDFLVVLIFILIAVKKIFLEVEWEQFYNWFRSYFMLLYKNDWKHYAEQSPHTYNTKARIQMQSFAKTTS